MGLYDQYLSMVQRSLDNQLASQQAIYANRPQSKLSSLLTGFQGGMSQARMDKENKAKAEREQAKFDLEQRRLQAELDRFGWQQRQAEEESRLALEDRPFSLREREAKTKMLEAQTESMLRPKPEGPPNIEFFRGGMGMRWDPESNAYVPATDAQGRQLYKYEPPRAASGGGASEPKYMIPGTAEWARYQAYVDTGNRKMHSAKMVESELDRLKSAVVELKADPGLKYITGGFGALPFRVPGTSAASAQAKLDNIKAQTGLSVLAAMREASKTGGTVGSVTEREHTLLQDSLAGLNNAQSEKDFVKALDKIIQFVDSRKNIFNEAASRDLERYGDFGAEPGFPRGAGGPPPGEPSALERLLGSGKTRSATQPKAKSLPVDIQKRVDALKAAGVPQSKIDAKLKSMGY